jgi:hypothetical protein
MYRRDWCVWRSSRCWARCGRSTPRGRNRGVRSAKRGGACRFSGPNPPELSLCKEKPTMLPSNHQVPIPQLITRYPFPGVLVSRRRLARGEGGDRPGDGLPGRGSQQQHLNAVRHSSPLPTMAIPSPGPRERGLSCVGALQQGHGSVKVQRCSSDGHIQLRMPKGQMMPLYDAGLAGAWVAPNPSAASTAVPARTRIVRMPSMENSF